MPSATRSLALAGACCGCLACAAFAWVSETFTATTSFSPNRLGASTNLSAKAVFATPTGLPTPISEVLAYGPAGLEVDVRGAGRCPKQTLESGGPGACPADSRIGFGGGVGLVEVAKEIVQEPFTLDFFLGPAADGHLVILIYADAVNPVSAQAVITATEVHASKPYGIGFSLHIPPIPTLPGAAYASVKESFFTIGAQKIAYYRDSHGGRRLIHVKGLVLPKSCPPGGFPFKVTIGFLNGTQSTATYSSRCPSA